MRWLASVGVVSLVAALDVNIARGHGVYVEWDRKIIWTFTNHGINALSAGQLLRVPNLRAPKEPFRNSAR